jgi:hypothetical protein
MKILKQMLTVVVMLVMYAGFAQNQSNEIMETTTTKKYIFEKEGKKIPYELKIYEKRNYVLKFKEEDEGKLNQGRVNTPAYVTKLILVNNDMDKSYDRYIVLRYKKSPSDSFELVPTTKGFAVKVDDNHLEYIMGEGVYRVNNMDQDYFIVDEFDKID